MPKSDAYIHVSEVEGLLKAAKDFCSWSPTSGAVSGYAWDLQVAIGKVEESIKNAEFQSVKEFYQRGEKIKNSVSPENKVVV